MCVCVCVCGRGGGGGGTQEARGGEGAEDKGIKGSRKKRAERDLFDQT